MTPDDALAAHDFPCCPIPLHKGPALPHLREAHPPIQDIHGDHKPVERQRVW
jgi:hypothetical protein